MNRVASAILLVLILLLVFITISGSHGLLHLLRINEEFEQLEQKNRELESEIVHLENKIYAIENSDYVLEQESREQLGLSKPGEIVYIFSDTLKGSSSESTDEQKKTAQIPKR